MTEKIRVQCQSCDLAMLIPPSWANKKSIKCKRCGNDVQVLPDEPEDDRLMSGDNEFSELMPLPPIARRTRNSDDLATKLMPPVETTESVSRHSLLQVVWMLLKGSREDSYNSEHYPALTGILRIGAGMARLWLVLSLFVTIVIGLQGFGGDVEATKTFCALFGFSPTVWVDGKVNLMTDQIMEGRLQFSAIIVNLWYLSITFLSIMGCLELVRLLLNIERNTSQGGATSEPQLRP
jgi:hypothetical protein